MAGKRDINIVDLEEEDWEETETRDSRFQERVKEGAGSGGRMRGEAGVNPRGGRDASNAGGARGAANAGGAAGDRNRRSGAGTGRGGFGTGSRGAAGGSGGNGNGTVVATALISVGILCLIIGGVFFMRSRMEAKNNREQLEVLNSQTEASQESSVQQEPAGTEGREGAAGAQAGAAAEGGQAGEAQPGAAGEGQEAGSGESASEETTPEPALTANPYAEYYLQNDDMVGWLKIDGTKIDYPVMQTMEDENYYLKRGFNKKSNQNGCLILDTDSRITEPLSTNLIIHGHNMKSGEMFGTLTDYEDEKFYEEHKTIKLYTEECERSYEVIAVFRSQVFRKTDDVFKFYKFFQADTQEEFDDWYGNIKDMSQYDTGVTAELGDRFLTLSTCVYHVENGRLVVVAKEVEPGEHYEPVR